MSTHNHTPVTTGAAANASTVNSPLGQIDNSIGNLSTLTTTEKGSIVGALNELDAGKMDLPSSQTANQVLASPDGSPGTPTFRSLVSGDLPASGVVAGTYTKTTVDAKGRVTSGQAQIAMSDISDLNSLKLDDLATPDDNTDLNVSTSRHGLFPKLINDAMQLYNGIGSWVKWAMGIKWNGSAAYTSRSYIDFRGTAVTVQDDIANDAVRVTISGTGGGASALDDLSDVSITTPAVGQVLTYSGSAWVNSAGGSGGGHVIQDEGSNMTNRPTLNFTGAGVTVTDDSSSNTTKVTINADVLMAQIFS